jgi:hypothetical protein
MRNVVLLGDSIFDNAAYVSGGSAVIDQLREKLPNGCQATLLAVDGHITIDVLRQLEGLPADTTHIFVSTGGNDALRSSYILSESARSVAEVLNRFAAIQDNFRKDYSAMLEKVLEHNKPTTVCTIYDSVPRLDSVAVTALSMFNDIILREAFRVKIPVIDLRLICKEPEDYSDISVIEPSIFGGEKITTEIVNVLTTYDFSLRQSQIFSSKISKLQDESNVIDHLTLDQKMLIEDSINFINMKFTEKNHNSYEEIGRYVLKYFFTAPKRRPRSYKILCGRNELIIHPEALSELANVASQDIYLQSNDIIIDKLSFIQKVELIKLYNSTDKLFLVNLIINNGLDHISIKKIIGILLADNLQKKISRGEGRDKYLVDCDCFCYKCSIQTDCEVYKVFRNVWEDIFTPVFLVDYLKSVSN